VVSPKESRLQGTAKRSNKDVQRDRASRHCRGSCKRRGRHLEERSALSAELDPEADRGARGHSLETLEETRQLALRGIDANTDQGKRALLELMQLKIFVDGRQLRLTGLFLHDLVIEW